MISFRHVTLHFGERNVFRDFNLQIKPGDKLLLCSPSGSGKSCLLRMIMGVLAPTSGEITVGGLRVEPASCRAVMAMLGYMSQRIDFPNGRVDAVFHDMFRCTPQSLYSPQRLKEALADAELPPDILHASMNSLPANERQRLAWIYIMLLDRPLLLLDEPTSALNSRQMNFFINYTMTSNKTVICSSHDPEWRLQNMRRPGNFIN
ncbi:MAG: ATP-binding cassette domain-containing protein [Bacteroidales bacterium]|jgi:ABC-type multidrug transport system ATPase subunit|nr:ATP-binding cassette domain-containing protein [Bacteroidales bacterium]